MDATRRMFADPKVQRDILALPEENAADGSDDA
jgi:hypothetical protein